MTDNTFALLHDLDAAPAQSLTSTEAFRRDTLLLSILATAPAAAPATKATRPVKDARRARRSALRWTGFGAGALLLGAAAVGVVSAAPHIGSLLHGTGTDVASGPLTTTQLASWTSTPASLSSTSSLAASANAWCTTNLGQANGGTGTPTITNADSRGSVASMLYERAGLNYYCISAGDGTGVWEVVDAAPATGDAPAVTGLRIDTAGSHGNGAAGLTSVVGFAGADVTKVVIHEPGHGDIVADLAGGRWTAWWPTPDDSAHGGPSGTITISTKDGQSHTVEAASVYPEN